MRLFEFGDLDCVPNWYHVYLREYLVFFYKVFGYYKLWVPAFTQFIKQTKAKEIMECCSGAGEPLVLIDAQLDRKEVGELNYFLSDIRPNPEVTKRFNQSENTRFHYIDKSVDVTQDLAEFDCPKVFINSFHHFTPDQVQKIMGYSFEHKNEIIILEYVRKSVMGVLSMVMGPIVVLLTLPFVVKLKDLPVMAFFTYLLPIFPLMMLWDGVVSCMHEYSEHYLRGVAKKFEYDVEITAEIKRNFLYPAGVSIIAFTYPVSKSS